MKTENQRIQELEKQLAIISPVYTSLLNQELGYKHELEKCEDLLSKCLHFMNHTTGRNTILVAQVRDYFKHKKEGQ